jgi:hypothetical protein
MAFVLETGDGLATANAYGEHTGLVAYAADRGTTLAQPQATLEQALIRATDFLQRRGLHWKGCQVKPLEQALDWPRYGVYDAHGYALASDELPRELVLATYELAIRALAADLSPDPSVDASGVAVVKSKDKVGPIEVEREFTGGSAGEGFFPAYPEVAGLLRKLVYSNRGVYRA